MNPDLRLASHALALMLAALALAPAPAIAQRAEPTDMNARADSLLQDLAKRELLQGAVVIAVGERPPYAAGFGFGDRAQSAPFTPDTPTDAASMAKTFTAAGLLLLASEGRLDLDSPVQRYLPTFPHADTRIRHLLTHAAGLPDYGWFDARVSPTEPRTNEGHLEVMARELSSPAFPPGTAFAYDNVAYDLGAMIIERVTDTLFAEFVATRFSGPLDFEAFVRPARFADWPGVRTRGYRRTADGFDDYDAYDLEAFYGADNIYLSARALQRWAAGYSRLMGPALLRDATRPARLDDGRSTGITMGSWYASPDGARRYYTGHHNGFYSIAYVDDHRGVSFAWVANDAPPAWLQTALPRALIAIAEGRTPEPLYPPPPATRMDDPSGVYEVGLLGDVTVHRDGRTLRVRQGGVGYDAFGIGQGVHYVPGLDAYLRFGIDSAGQTTLSWDSLFLQLAGIPRR